ncbi:MAG TPA: aspartate aminotransferase family protein [Burkholderiales bacterium]
MNPADLEHYWMPFTPNRAFKERPRLVVGAKDMYFRTADGREVLDAFATMWCVNAGHCRPRIAERIARQSAVLDFATSYSLGHPHAFELARRVAALAPKGLDRVFFTCSGSEAVDTALKIALAFHRRRGEGTRQCLIGRERGYHGANIAGTSVGGQPANRRDCGSLLPRVDHLRHTQDLSRSAFSRGMPAEGAALADELEARIIPLHGAENIAALIVEPVAGVGGVLIPPRGYLERLREICDRHGILLIFDEVITGFGRLGRPFASQYFGVTPDLITFAKGITNAAVPMGGVLVKRAIYDAFMQSSGGEVEFAHGYTYSGHPLACAAAFGALETYEEERLFERAAAMAADFEEGIHRLRGERHVVDARNLQLLGAIEFAPRPGALPRAAEVSRKCWEKGVYVRALGEAIGFCPPLIVEKKHLDQLFATVAEVVRTVH